MSVKNYKYIVNDKSNGRVLSKRMPAVPTRTDGVVIDLGLWDSSKSYRSTDDEKQRVAYDGSFWIAMGNVPAGEKPSIGSKYWRFGGFLTGERLEAHIIVTPSPVNDSSSKTWVATLKVQVTHNGKDITDALPSDGWKWSGDGEITEAEDKTTATITDAQLPKATGRYSYKVVHTKFGVVATADIIRIDINAAAGNISKLEQMKALVGDLDSDVLDKINKAIADILAADSGNRTYYSKPTKYKKGDSWLLQEDTEIAGTTYKAGTIVYAHATRESGFVQADWLTNAYITQAEIDDLQIGVVNLVQGTSQVAGGSRFYTKIDVKGSKQIAVSCLLRHFFGEAPAFQVRDTDSKKILFSYTTESKDFVKVQKVITLPDDCEMIDVLVYVSGTGEGGLEHKELIVVAGNKVPLTWSPSPEDVQIAIDEVRGSVDGVTASVNNLRNEVTTTFADGVVDKAEAKAIEKYINIIKADKAALEATYNKLFANELLKGNAKSSLTNAKVTYFGAVENLLRSINSAISDGKATAAEKADVDRKYSAYRDALSAFNSAINVASDSISKGAIANVQIGGRNLLVRSKVFSHKPYNTISVDERGTITAISNMNGERTILSLAVTGLRPIGLHTFSGYFKVNGKILSSQDFGIYRASSHNGEGKYSYDEKSGYAVFIENYNTDNSWILHFWIKAKKGDAITIDKAKFERGNKATDYSPAPEDLMAEMQKSLEDSEKRSKAAWESYAQAQSALAQARAEATADGKITKEEQKRIDAVSNALQKAKEYANAQDALLRTQQQAYADGKITEAEQRAIEVAKAKAKVAEENAIAYADGKLTEEEKKRIAAAQKAYDDAIAKAKELDDSISIGGRNLFVLKNISHLGTDAWNFPCKLIDGNRYRSYYMKVSPGEMYVVRRGNPRSNRWGVGISKVLPENNVPIDPIANHNTSIKGHNEVYIFTIPDGYNYIYLYLSIDDEITHDDQIKIERGNKATDWTPAPEDTQAQIDAEKKAREDEARKLRSDLGDANKLIKTLQTITTQLKEGKLDAADFEGIKYLTDALANGNTQMAGGLLLTRVIALSNQLNQITSYLNGDNRANPYMLRAGVEGFGTANESSKVSITHDGKVVIGNMELVNGEDEDSDRIVFKGYHITDTFVPQNPDGTNDYSRYKKRAFMQVGGKSKTEEEMLDDSTNIEDFELSPATARSEGTHVIDRFTSRESNRDVKYTLKLTALAEVLSYMLPSPAEENDPYQYNMSECTVVAKITVKTPGDRVKFEKSSSPLTVTARVTDSSKLLHDEQKDSVNLTLVTPKEMVAEGDKIELTMEVRGIGTFAVSATDIHNFVPSDIEKPFITFAKEKISMFFSRQKYVLFNYFSDLVLKVVGNVKVQGKLEVTDELKAGHIDTSGAVLCGGEYDVNRGVQSSFGKYKNRSGRTSAKVEKLGSGSSCYFRVYHSIGNTKYIPYVTAYKVPYSDQPSVVDKQSDHFDVRFYNGNSQSYHYSFNYICHRAD